ncbi:MAG: hypothetical protein LBV16_05540 [Elusimicrobiota bacterium]|jgi:hypothetical protein|nr:hypothetical protein [Elusimicrobiota bacterium]
MPREKRKAISSLGGKISGQIRKEKRTYAELARYALTLKPGKEIIGRTRFVYPEIKDETLTVKEMMVLGIANRAMHGDVGAFVKMQELAPDKNDDTQQSGALNLSDFYACCEACGYPKPYPKQIEMADFVFDMADEPKMLLGARKYGKTDYCTIVKARI